MNRYYQQGMSTLLITSMLLVVALIFSLASYKNLFYQIKRTQNEVLARQAHWAAEGGLECGFTLLNMTQDIALAKILLPDKCESPIGLEQIKIEDSHPIKTLTSTFSERDVTKVIAKQFTFGGKGFSGVLKSSSDIYFKGSFILSPDPGTPDISPLWQCVVFRFKTKFMVEGHIVNQGLIERYPPYADFPTGQRCNAGTGYQSIVTTGLWNGANIIPHKDFVYDSDYEPFFDTFYTPRENWKEIKNRSEFKKIYGNNIDVNGQTLKLVNNCEAKIAQAIDDNYDLIWVDGSCELNNLDSIDTAISNNRDIKGVILVVQDGIFSVDGVHKFPGMIYHFNINFQPHPNFWSIMSSHKSLSIPSSLDLSKVSYYQVGAFMPVGGYVLDAPGQIAAFSASMNFLFNRDLIEKPLDKLKKFSWLQGSWHDF
ncbi:hypothetical protein [Photobacterium damselae]